MITVDASEINRVAKELGEYKSKAPVAIYRAINRAASNAKTNATKKVRENYNIKAKDINSTIKITKATRSNLVAIVKSSGYRIPLNKFKVSPSNPRPKNPPNVLRVEVKKTGLKEVVGAFVANINGNKVFKRTSNSRLPIQQLFGPAVPQMMNNENVREYIEEQATKMYEQRLEHEIDRIKESGRLSLIHI